MRPGLHLVVVNLSPRWLGQLSKALFERFKESLVDAAGPSIDTLTSATTLSIERDSLPLMTLAQTENILSAGASLYEVGPGDKSANLIFFISVQ